MTEAARNHPKSILKKHPSPAKETQDEATQQDAPIQKTMHRGRNISMQQQVNVHVNTPNHLHFGDESDNSYQSTSEPETNIKPLTDNNSNINIPEKIDTEGKQTTNFSKIFGFFSKFWNPDNIDVSDPKAINKKTNSILKSYKNHQYKYLMLLSVVCPIFIPILVARATVDLVNKVKLTPMKHQKNIEDPIVNKFMYDLTEAVNTSNVTGIAKATAHYLYNAIDPSLDSRECKNILRSSALIALRDFIEQIQIMPLSVDRQIPLDVLGWRYKNLQPLDIFLTSLNDSMVHVPLEKLESTKIALTGLEQTLEEHAKKLPPEELAEFEDFAYMISNIQEEVDVAINTVKSKEGNSERGKKLKLLLEDKKRERKKKINSKIESGRITLSHRPNKQRKQYTKLIKKGVEIKDDNIEKLYEKQNRTDDDVGR